jgi:hypothetical protein
LSAIITASTIDKSWAAYFKDINQHWHSFAGASAARTRDTHSQHVDEHPPDGKLLLC